MAGSLFYVACWIHIVSTADRCREVREGEVMNIKLGKGTTEYGPGVNVELDGDEVATAIGAYLVAHGVHVVGPRTISVNGELCEFGRVYVDPSGFVISGGCKISGNGQ